MALAIHEESDPKTRRALQERLTAQLPQWFGQPDSNAKYARAAEALDGFVATIDGEARGLLLLKFQSPISAEIYWMGVEPNLHRAGIGRALVEAAQRKARARAIEYLFVATLHPDDPYEPYRRTRMFYEALGFAYVLEEQFPADPENRLAFYLKAL